jgi:uncharacterized protein (TIGR00369 family)
MSHQPQDPDYIARVRTSFAQQKFMVTLGATLAAIRPGEIVIELPFGADLTQQHGFLHAGVITSVLDSACGYAALSLMPSDAAVLTVEFKVNLLAPAGRTRFRAVGTVVRAGRTLTVCSGELLAGENEDQVVAVMQATMIAVRGREGFVG